MKVKTLREALGRFGDDVDVIIPTLSHLMGKIVLAPDKFRVSNDGKTLSIYTKNYV